MNKAALMGATLAAMLGSVGSWAFAGGASEGVGAKSSKPATGFAVLELFTSEGCSSCPPADSVVSSIEHDAALSGLPVYALEWHVDYWDYLGWRDPYDSQEATARQQDYARVMRSELYTPQLIVNGADVPSYAGDLGEVRRLVDAATRRPAAAGIAVTVASTGDPAVYNVHVALTAYPSGALLQVLVAEQGLSGDPNAGENAGRHLVHSNVVRLRVSVPKGTSDVAVKLPPGVVAERSSVIGILQDRDTLKILAASQAPLPAQAAAVSGRVIDSTGTGIEGVAIQACSGRVCVPATTDARGYFSISDLAAGTYVLDFRPAKSGAAAGKPSEITVEVPSGKTLEIPSVVMES